MILKPFVCGKTKIFFPSICSDSPYFTGTVDATIRQGTDFDLRAGVNAYDADGMTIPFTVTPSEVEVCQLGVQSFVYEAEGAKDTRYITVVAVDNPTITGLTPLTVKIGEEFDPNEGVVATDGNGNTVTPTVKAYPSIYGLTDIRVQVGNTINTLDGVTAKDGDGNPITVTCAEGSTFTPSAEGEYTLHYSATSDGMTTTGERKVTAGVGYFTGVNDATVTQGTDFDLRSGVKAYDFNGNEVSFTVSSEFVPCNVGVQTYIYRASGVPDTERKITVTAIANPTISGVSEGITVAPSVEFDPLDGVSATDGNGNAIPSSDITVTEVTSTSHTVTLHAGAGGSVSGGGTFEDGTQITVTATPNTNYSFEKWAKSSGGTAVSTSTSYTFTVTEDVDLYASFTYHEPTPTTYTVTLLGGGYGWGTTNGEGTFESGTIVTVTATPSSGYEFANWRRGSSSGEIVSSSSAYTFTLTEDVTLYAVFERESVPETCTVSFASFYGGTASGGGTYPYGTSVTVRAIPDSEHQFVNWRRDSQRGAVLSADDTYTFTLTEDITLYPAFEASATPSTCTVTLLGGGSGWGTTSGGGTYTTGSTVTVVATPGDGYAFSHWANGSSSGATVSIDESYTFTLTEDVTLYAVFERE